MVARGGGRTGQAAADDGHDAAGGCHGARGNGVAEDGGSALRRATAQEREARERIEEREGIERVVSGGARERERGCAREMWVEARVNRAGWAWGD